VEALDEEQEVARLRRWFADQIESFDEKAWNSASWCAGWSMRDVLAHLVQNAERTYGSLTVDLVRGGFGPDRSMSKAAKRLRDLPVPELAGRLRRAADRHFRLPGNQEGMGLVDVLVHGADAFRPVGVDVDAPPADAVPALDALWKRGRVIVHAVPQRDRRLRATDVEWCRGSGPEVTGRAIDLLLLVANRRQVLPQLDGPGLVGL
jgi:uncharacterized protein (TIGR03083 family)